MQDAITTKVIPAATDASKFSIQVPEQQGNYGLQILNTQGKAFTIPLLLDYTPYINQEQHKLVAVEFNWDPSLDLQSDSLATIVSLPNWLREKVYANILAADPKQWQNWRELLSPELRSAVQTALSEEHYPELVAGWLYIYKDGKLWRECRVVDGFYKDVDLATYAGLDQRPATGVNLQQIILADQLNGFKVNNTVAFSHVQWSWARINYYGGMDSNDPRVSSAVLASVDTEDTDAARFTKINLDTITSLNNKISLEDYLQLAKRQQADLAKFWGELLDCLSKISKTEFFDSAVLAYHLFYNPQVKQHEYAYDLYQVGVTPHGSNAPITKYSNTNYLASHREGLDQVFIETTLDVEHRARLRKLIRKLQKNFCQLFQTQDLETKLIDYFAASISAYPDGFSYIAKWLALLHTDPNTMDHNLDVSADELTLNELAGINLIFDLLQPEHKLNPILIPNTETIDIYNPGEIQDQNNCIPIAENTGDGKFRKIAFKCLYQASVFAKPIVKRQVLARDEYEFTDNDESYETVIEEVPGFLSQAIDSLINSISRSAKKFSQRIKDTPDFIALQKQDPDHLSAPVKLLRSSGMFDQLFLEQGISPENNTDNFIPGLMFDDIPAQEHDFSLVPTTAVPIYISGEQQASGFAENFGNYGVKNPQNYNVRTKLSKQLKTNYLLKMRLDQELLQQASAESWNLTKWFDHILKFLFAGKKSLSVTLSILALANTEEAVLNLISKNEKSASRKLIELSGSLVALLASSKETAEILFSSDTVAKYLKTHPQLNYLVSEQVIWSKMLASRLQHSIFILSLLGFYFSIADLTKAIWEGKYVESLGMEIGIVGNGILLGSQIGANIMAKLELELQQNLLQTTTKQLVIEELVAELSWGESFFVGMGPLVWVGVVCVLLGSLLSVWLEEDKLSKWVRCGPFSKNKKTRLAKQYTYWREPKNQYLACQALMDLIMRPVISKVTAVPEQNPEAYMVEVVLKYFIPGKDCLDVRAVWQVETKILTGQSTISFWQTVKIAKPYKIMQVMSKGLHPQVAKMQYFYNDFPKLSRTIWLQQQLRLNAKVRLILADGKFVLPCSELPLAADNDLSEKPSDEVIDPKQPGWVYCASL